MKTLKLALAAALTMPALSVFAEEAESDHSVSYNIGLFSEYVFRGYTQTHNDPALQGGIDYEHSSGLYLGAWMSNVSWTTDGGASSQFESGGTLEIDIYGGFAGEFGETGIGYDVGFLQYLYPGEMRGNSGYGHANTLELYAGLSYKDLSATYYEVMTESAWTWGKNNGVGDSAKGTWYLSVDYEHDVGQYFGIDGLTASLHYGRQEFDGTLNEPYDYSDYLFGLEKEVMGFNVGYNLTTTNQSKSTWVPVDGKYLGETRNVLYVAKEF
jgi:uncharacterized protein (TIGR02001 family)